MTAPTSTKEIHVERYSRFTLALVVVVAIVLAWSGVRPHDRWTWFLETFPVMIAFVVLGATYRRFPLTWLAYLGVALHCVILCVGGRYTYAMVPLGDWFREALDLSRNHYDRLGHIAQGFFPAILARELLLRTSPLSRGKWLSFLVVATCLAISAFYELIEWWVAAATGEAADAFLGSQGDVWDSQWDMFLALCGAMASLTLMGRVHDRALGLGRKSAPAA
ncbi:MAG TPA: DUF2238 domain-containing protein [Phycisphaerae bacterium]|nr:DUF2238 domain-containing protein [Phycisphaerae bacterium]HRW53500.1 DUF2238 domain-containing protein [Phycisphaerae bacterium]